MKAKFFNSNLTLVMCKRKRGKKKDKIFLYQLWDQMINFAVSLQEFRLAAEKALKNCPSIKTL